MTEEAPMATRLVPENNRECLYACNECVVACEACAQQCIESAQQEMVSCVKSAWTARRSVRRA